MLTPAHAIPRSLGIPSNIATSKPHVVGRRHQPFTRNAGGIDAAGAARYPGLMKEAIIDLAIRQLRLGGYDMLNFAEIARELGTTRANLHHHFNNKEGLAKAAVDRYVSDQRATVKKIFSDHIDDFIAVLSELEDHLIDAAMSDRATAGCLGSQLIRDSVAPASVRDIVLARFREEMAEVRSGVERHLQAHPDAYEGTAKQLTFKLIAAMHGIDTIALFADNKTQIPALIKGSLTQLLD